MKKAELPTRPRTRADEQMVLNAFKIAIQGLESIVGANVEIVLHDLRHPRASTLAIANGHVSGRQVGDPIIAAPKNDKGFSPLLAGKLAQDLKPDTMEDYRSRTRDGRELRSTTIFLRNEAGEAYATVCANHDLTMYQLLQVHLQQIVQPAKPAAQVQRRNKPNVDELIEEIISESLDSIGKPVISMDKDDKVRVIEMMVERGLFVIKGSAERVAHRLGVSRFTVYNYLGALKMEDAPEPPVSPARQVARPPALPAPTRATGRKPAA